MDQDTFPTLDSITQSLPAIEQQIRRLQENAAMPQAVKRLDISFLLLTARLKHQEDMAWGRFLGHLGLSLEMGDAYLQYGEAYLALERLEYLDLLR